jgi:GPH family glycoside/pentoside/hexuronide:cation symporter
LDTPPSERVPLTTNLAYGAAAMNNVLYGHLPQHLATPIYVAMLGLSPLWVSMAMMIFRIYDAFTDPVMGWISDNTRSRWGRRRPYLFVGALLCGLTMPLMWFVGPSWSSNLQIGWLIATGAVFFTCTTIFLVPYFSFFYEITPDYNERTRVSSYSAFFGKLATLIVGWAWFFTQLPYFKDADGQANPLLGAQALSIVLAVLTTGLGILPALFMKERFYQVASRQAKTSLTGDLKGTLRNKPFLILTAFAAFFATGTFLVWSLEFYARLYWVCQGDAVLAAKLGGSEATISTVLGFASIPVTLWFSRRCGKSNAMFFAMALCIVSVVCRWWVLNPNYPWVSLFSNALMAPALTCIWQIIPSMAADCVDYDELKTGTRNEGVYAATFSWFMKASFTVGLSLAGPVVIWCGFQSGKDITQTAEAIQAIRLCDALLPALILSVGLIAIRFYPLTAGRMAEIRGELEARRGEV